MFQLVKIATILEFLSEMEGNQDDEILKGNLDDGLQPRSDSFNELLYRLEQQNR